MQAAVKRNPMNSLIVPEKVPVDIWGIIFIMLTFFGLVYGFANMASFRENPAIEIGAFVIGIVALGLFVKHCSKCENPLIDISIFTNIPFTCHLVAFFLINAIMLGTSFLLPNYLQVALLCESMAAGFMLLPRAGLNALMGPFSGAALDKVGAKLPILTGTSLMTIGILLFTVFGMKLNTGMIIGFYIIFGIGCGIAFGNTMTIGNLRLPVQQKAYGNTSFNTLMQFAGAVGTSVCAALVASVQNQNNKAAMAPTICPMTVAIAAPRIPIAGQPSRPKIIMGSRIMFKTAPMIREIIDKMVSPTAYSSRCP